MSNQTEIAIVGGGCFWCTEAVFQRVPGVQKVESGYEGGKNPNPTYREICTGTTGHAEVVKIEFDPTVLSFKELLKVFFATHDPTTLNRQGADRGTQYRSVIFYQNIDQEQQAREVIEELKTKFADPIVTELSYHKEFFVAENYHQNYFNEHGHEPYCAFVIKPKLEKIPT
jgi:methionine-S-sulfoxide reductase